MKFEQGKRRAKTSGSKGGRLRQANIRHKITSFPKAFLALLNARTITSEANKEMLGDLTFGLPRRVSPIGAGTTFLSKLLSAPSKVFHEFTKDEVEELQDLASAIFRDLGIRFACDSSAGTRHLTPLPIAVGYLRILAGGFIAGHTAKTLNGTYSEMIAFFRQKLRWVLGNARTTDNQTTDNAWTLSNCESAIALLTRFFEMDPGLLRLLRQCKNPECAAYFLQAAVHPKAHCDDYCRYRAHYLKLNPN